MPGSFEDLLCFIVGRTRKSIVRRLNEELYERSIPVTFDQFIFLYKLSIEAGAVTQQHMARATGNDKSAILRTIAILEKKNLVTRMQDADDRRKNRITLTADGERLFAQVSRLFDEINLEFKQGIGDADYASLVRSLRRIQENAKQHEKPHPLSIMNHTLKTAVPGTLLALAMLAASCNNKPSAPPPTGPKDYALISLERQKATLNLDYPATLEGQQTVEIRPRVEGIIEAVFVDEGQVVRRGQPLFRLDQAKYVQNIRSFEALIKTAQAEVSAAQMEVNKVKPLVEKDIVSKFSLESAQYTLQAKEASLAQAKASLANAKTDLSYTVITSPANGIIGTLPFKIGALVGSSMQQPLTTVANTADVYAYFSLNETQLGDFGGAVKGGNIREQIKHAPRVTLLLPDGTEYGEPGRIETVSGLIDPQTGSARMRATFPNSSGLLRSGGSGTVRIPIAIDTALLVPQKATYEIQGKKFVYVFDAADSNKVKATEIRVNPVAYNQSFVVQAGLKPGDKVVIEGTAGLADGTIIKPRIVPADSVYNSKPKL